MWAGTEIPNVAVFLCLPFLKIEMSPLLSPYQLSDTIALQVTMPLWCSSVQDLEQVLQGCAALLSTHLTHTVAMKSCVGADL